MRQIGGTTFCRLKKNNAKGVIRLEKDKRCISHVRAHLCTLSTRRSRGRTICLLLFSQTRFVKGVNGHNYENSIINRRQ